MIGKQNQWKISELILQGDVGDEDMDEGPQMETAIVLHEVLNSI